MNVLRNSVYNLLGLGLPGAIALVSIPALIHALGSSRFGILTIIWSVVSYFGLFDLGLGRAVTQQVAAALGAGENVRLRAIVGTSSVLMAALGIIGGVALFLATPLLVRQLADGRSPAEWIWAFRWMALAMPAIILTSGYRGMLEALGKFALINIIRFPMGVFTFVGPLMAVWTGYARLDVITAVLCIGRIIACGLHAYFSFRALPRGIGWGSVDRSMTRSLLGFGGWLSVSNVISPLMSYVDRIIIGAMVSAAAVAYYATPQELIMRVGIVPSAVAAVLFPMFAATMHSTHAATDRANVARYTWLILALMAPVSLGLFLFAKPLLIWWISADFAGRSARILQIMAVAALASGVAQVPFTMLQGKGRADLTAKLHIVELPLYLGLLYFLVRFYGQDGAAWAWLIRIVGDMGALYYFNASILSGQSPVFALSSVRASDSSIAQPSVDSRL